MAILGTNQCLQIWVSAQLATLVQLNDLCHAWPGRRAVQSCYHDLESSHFVLFKPRALSSVVSIQRDAILPEKRWLCFCVSFGSKVSPYDLFSSSPSLSGLYCSAATYVVKYKVRACPSVVPFVHGCYSGTVQANPWINFPVLLFSASVPHIY